MIGLLKVERHGRVAGSKLVDIMTQLPLKPA